MLPPLTLLLDEIRYDDAVRMVFGANYKVTSLYDDPALGSLSPSKINDLLKKLPLNRRQRIALRFFLFGQTLPDGELAVLSQSRGPTDVFKSLGAGVHVTSYRLAGSPERPLYLVADLPKRFSQRSNEPTAQIGVVALRLLRVIEERAAAGFGENLVDMGSGAGLQSIAALLTNRDLSKAFALEVDEHALALSRFNAELNGVSDRFIAIENNGAAFVKALGTEKIDFIVSNPPVNVVPEFMKDAFPRFGYGGPDGLAVTRLFLEQIIPHLKVSAEIVLFGQFARGSDEELLLQKFLSATYPQLKAKYEIPTDLLERDYFFEDLPSYVKAIHYYITEVAKRGDGVSEEAITKDLEVAGVSSLWPVIVTLSFKDFPK